MQAGSGKLQCCSIFEQGFDVIMMWPSKCPRSTCALGISPGKLHRSLAMHRSIPGNYTWPVCYRRRRPEAGASFGGSNVPALQRNRLSRRRGVSETGQLRSSRF